MTTYPRTGITDIEMIPAVLCRELGPGLLGNPFLERALRTLELARFPSQTSPQGSVLAVLNNRHGRHYVRVWVRLYGLPRQIIVSSMTQTVVCLRHRGI